MVDNCSTDNSFEQVFSYASKNENLYILKNKINLGRIQNWNKCLDIFYKSNHKYLRFLFTGDTLVSNCIEKSEKIFEKNQDISILISSYFFQHSEKNITISKINIPEGRYNLEALIGKRLFPSRFSGPIVRNSFNKKKMKNTYFNENYTGTATFTNDLVTYGDLYYTNDNLCTFVKSSRKSFHKEHDYSVNSERLYTALLAIDKLKGFQGKKNKMKHLAVINFLIYLLKYKFLPTKLIFYFLKKIYLFYKKFI